MLPGQSHKVLFDELVRFKREVSAHREESHLSRIALYDDTKEIAGQFKSEQFIEYLRI